MAKKINWDEYNIRTLTYYQKQGGVFSDLITVLQKARTDKSVVGYFPKHTPARLLNIASYIADLAMADKANSGQLIVEQKQQYSNRLKDDQYLVFSIVYILIGDLDCEGANHQLMQYIGTSDIYRRLNTAYNKEAGKGKFQLQEVMSSEDRKRYEKQATEYKFMMHSLETRNEQLTVSLAAKDNELADARKSLKEKENIIKFMEEDEQTVEEPSLDDVFTFDNTLEYIQTRQHYSFCSQIFSMVKDMMMSNRHLVTDDQFQRLSAAEQRMLMKQDDQHVVNINYNFGSMIMQGLVESEEFKKLTQNLPIGKDPKEIATEMIKLYLENGKSEQ